MKKLIGKILIIVLPLIFAVVLLYPTYKSSQLEAKKSAVLAMAAKDKNRLDSIARIEKFEASYGDELTKSKSGALKLGLDLRGGMYVTLEVDIVKLIEESALRESVDETFNDVIEKTRNEARNSDAPVIDIFMKYFNSIAKPKGKSLINYFDIGDMRDVTEEKILEKLKSNADGAIDQAKEVIRQRVDKYGIAEPTIQKQGTRRIVLELPGVNNEGEMRKLLQTTARLEFNLVRNNKDIVKAFYKIDKLLANQAKRKQQGLTVSDTVEKAQVDSSSIAAKDSSTTQVSDSASKASKDTANPYAGLSEKETQKRYLEDHPFTTLFSTYYIQMGSDGSSKSMQVGYSIDNFPEGEYNFMITHEALEKFNRIMNRPDVKALIPADLKIAREAKPDQRIEKDSKVKVYSFYSLKREPEITGEYVTDARASFDQSNNQPMVLMGMNSDGAERWARITGANLKKRIAIVLDDQVYSAPTVQSKITGGSSQITGMANAEEAHLLEIVLKAGALKAPVQIIEERVVGPSLGEDSINSGLYASLVALIAVVLFMVIYYNMGGIVADFSVVLNVVLVIAILAAFGGTLTLPGIAGLILTIGMAVDANILIYERIREELFKGRSMKSAIDEGFKRALSAIIDSNVTTFLTGLILYFFGTGPIQGFAMTLMIGIIATLFTQILVSKAIIQLIMSRGGTHFNFGQPKNLVQS